MVLPFSMNGKIMKVKSPIKAGVRLGSDFYMQDILNVAPGLLGKILALAGPDGTVHRHVITETEAYRGMEDKACHASKGKTARTEVMFRRGGYVYVYFVYGMYWMLNVVAGPEGEPQASLIRCLDQFEGPGRLTRALGIDGSFYAEDLLTSNRIWIEDSGLPTYYRTAVRIGVNYAGEPWKSMPWRYILGQD